MQLASPVKKLIHRTDNAQELCWFLRKNPTKQAYSRAKQIFTAISKAYIVQISTEKSKVYYKKRKHSEETNG